MSNGHNPFLRAGIDIGGTFTDLVMVDEDGNFVIGKTLTTPEDPSQAIETALLDACKSMNRPPDTVDVIVHGTTLVTNALIERKGERTALITTEGFRDAVEIGRENRYDLHDLTIENPKPLVPRYLRFGVKERTQSDGTIKVQLDEQYLEKLTMELVKNHVVAVAVVFLNSFANPSTERRAREIIHRVAPQMRVSLSSEVSPTIREFQRTSTTIANVYIQARVDTYLKELLKRLEKLSFQGSFLMMLSNGGTSTANTARAFPIRLLESGPAAGALAAATYGAACGYRDLVSFDMGGTTAKFCVIDDGKPSIAHEFEFDRIYRFRKGSGLPATIPVIEMVEIGAGGGSVARINSLGLLKIGPDSAGAFPGPVCYGRGGTEPTVTDADLLLGYLDPKFFLGGRMGLNLSDTKKVIEDRLASKLSLPVEEVAWGIHQIVNEIMASAARAHILERGKDPQAQPLFAFGGAGPVHAYRIAKALGSPRLIVPLGAGIMSSVGFLSAPIGFDFARPWRTPLESVDWPRAKALLAEMEAEGRALLIDSDVSEDEISMQYSVEMRYVGQGYEISVPLPISLTSEQDRLAILVASFEEAYLKLYGRPGPPVPLEIVTWRLLATGKTPGIKLRRDKDVLTNRTSPIKHHRQVYFPELNGFSEVPVYDRYAMPPGFAFRGPAIVEERESTTVLGPDAKCHIDQQWNLVAELQ